MDQVVIERNQYPQSPIAKANEPSWAVNVGNYASNPGFEHTTPVPPAIVSSTVPAGVANAWGLSGTAAIVNNNARTDSRAMSIPSGSSANQMITGVYSAYTFDVSAWVKGAAAGDSGTMRVEFLGFKDELIGGSAGTVNTALAAASAYARASSRVTAPTGTKKLRVTFLASSGTIFVDDVEIRKVK